MGERFLKNTPKPFSYAPPAILSTFCPLPSDRAPLRRSARFSRRIPAVFVKVSSDDYVETQDISRMIKSESGGRSDESLRPRKKKKATRRDLSKACTQAPGSGESLLSPSASQAEVFENYRLREKLKAVPRSFLKSYFWWLKFDLSDKGPRVTSGSGGGKPSLDRSSGCRKDVEHRNTQAG